MRVQLRPTVGPDINLNENEQGSNTQFYLLDKLWQWELNVDITCFDLGGWRTRGDTLSI
jgi:hypothetical protein